MLGTAIFLLSLIQHPSFNLEDAGRVRILHFPPLLAAAPSQEDVFKSIQTSVDEPATGGKGFPFVLAGAGVIILLALFTQRRKRVSSPKALNNPGKLLKEVLRTVPLRSVEVKQLKLLVESSRGESSPSHPLTLLICPSLLAESIRNRPAKANNKVLAQLAKRSGLIAQTQARLQEQKQQVSAAREPKKAA